MSLRMSSTIRCRIFQVGVEYNWGMRKDMDGTSGHANRISVLAQYSF